MNSRLDSFLLRAEQTLDKYALALRSIASGFLLGRFTNEVNESNTTFFKAIRGTFDFSQRDNNTLSWIALIVVIGLPFGIRKLMLFNRRRQRTEVFSKILKKYRSELVAPISGMAWGSSVTLQSAPNIYSGWRHDEVSFDHRAQHFSFPQDVQEAYATFCGDNHDRHRLADDGVKVWLTRNPVSFVDSPRLVLETRLARYSQCKFKEERLVPDAEWREAMLREVVNGTIGFPHALCLHAIVTTADDRVLLTKRSSKVAYYPGNWSCSLEEQLIPEDLVRNDSVILYWSHRMLDEELGIGPSELNEEDVRVMSVFLEADTMNVSLCASIALAIDSSELDNRLKLLPRKDYEFVDWQFMTYDELAEELRSPSNHHHGSAGYRMLFALIRRLGNPGAIERILRQRGFSS
ncbi:hypothetical protein [Rubrivivax sp. JA1026]|uniref:hypothetical protein n=1 Tax=Rubrivivax sp. JA1026 TaxID=2710888 RepID=UPI0013E9153E|nr:hypothetical protein [Rubrivivax sp. JA1026]